MVQDLSTLVTQGCIAFHALCFIGLGLGRSTALLPGTGMVLPLEPSPTSHGHLWRQERPFDVPEVPYEGTVLAESIGKRRHGSSYPPYLLYLAHLEARTADGPLFPALPHLACSSRDLILIRSNS